MWTETSPCVNNCYQYLLISTVGKSTINRATGVTAYDSLLREL